MSDEKTNAFTCLCLGEWQRSSPMICLSALILPLRTLSVLESVIHGKDGTSLDPDKLTRVNGFNG